MARISLKVIRILIHLPNNAEIVSGDRNQKLVETEDAYTYGIIKFDKITIVRYMETIWYASTERECPRKDRLGRFHLLEV